VERPESNDQREERTGRAVSRREFLKMAGVAGAAIGAAGGLGGILAACGGDEETTTTAGATTTTAGATTTTAGATTTVSAGAEQGSPLKVGIVVPMTGPLAEFGAPTKYLPRRSGTSPAARSSPRMARNAN